MGPRTLNALWQLYRSCRYTSPAFRRVIQSGAGLLFDGGYSMHKRFCVAAVWLFVLVLLSPATAVGQSPWKKLVPFKRVEADPQKSYAVTDTNGPWMIVATVFRGEAGRGKGSQACAGAAQEAQAGGVHALRSLRLHARRPRPRHR